MMTIFKVFEMIQTIYNEARNNPAVRKPLAYALYKTWRYVDSHEKEKGAG